MNLPKAKGAKSGKVFKMNDVVLKAGKPQNFKKKHRFKDNATTFTLYPGPRRLDIQANGCILTSIDFDLLAPSWRRVSTLVTPLSTV